MAKKKKSNSVGRYGARYGVRIRRRVREIETRQRQKHRCPQCGYEKVKRESAGIWRCRKCDHKFAGGAYVPETPGYKASQRQLKEALERDEDDFPEDEDAGSSGVLDESQTVAPGTEPGEPEETEGPEPEEAAPEELTPEERVFDEAPDEDDPAPEPEGPGATTPGDAEEVAPEELIPSESEGSEASTAGDADGENGEDEEDKE